MSEPGRLRDRVPVESLDDERLSRIERNLVLALPARAPARRAFAPWIAAAAIAAAALIAWRVAPRGEAPITASPTVVVAGEGGARVELGDAVVVAGAGAAFTVTRPDGGVDIALAHGRIELDVLPRKGRPPLIVRADDVAVVVVGTKFSVERGDEVIVNVTEGLVRVERAGAADMVAAGQAWSEPARTAVAIAEPVARRDAPIAPGDPVEVDVLHDREAAVPEVDAGPDEPPAPVKPGGGTKKPPKPEPKPEVVVDPLGELVAEIKAQTLATTGEGAAGELYARAYALFRASKSREALRLINQYDERFPKNADATWLRVRIECADGIDDGCRKAATTYLNRHDDGSKRAAIARRIKTTQ